MTQNTLSTAQLSDDQIAWIVSTLAMTDALFAPWRLVREPSHSAWSACFDRRVLYLAQGLPQRVGSDVAGRKSAERFAGELESLGWLRCSVHQGVRFTKLTDAADEVLRELVGLPGMTEALPHIKTIRRLHVAGMHNEGFVSELDILNNGRDWSRVNYSDESRLQIWDLESVMAPLLCRGITESHSDGGSHVGYAIRKPFTPTPSGPLDGFNQRWGDAYDDAYNAAMTARANWKQPDRSRIAIPLGCGSWAANEPS